MARKPNRNRKVAIHLQKTTRIRLAKTGNMIDDWDSVINELLNHAEHCDLWWAERK